MSSTTTHRVTLKLVKDYRIVGSFPDLPDAAPIVFDEPPPLGSGEAPSGVDVVGAAVGNCLAASLAFCLRKARVPLAALEARVETDVARDERGKLRITGISVELVPELADDNKAGLNRCEQIFEDFCTVTASIRRGIKVGVRVHERAGAPR